MEKLVLGLPALLMEEHVTRNEEGGKKKKDIAALFNKSRFS